MSPKPLTLVLALSALVAAACPSGHTSEPKRIAVTATGRIGPLHDSRSGKLALLYTKDHRFTDSHGVHVATTTAASERLLRRRVFVGCYDGLRVDTKTGFLVMWFEGGKTVAGRGDLHLVGGHLAFLVVHSRRRNPGVLDCVDS